MTSLRRALGFFLSVAVLIVGPWSSAQQKRAITPRDCVTVRDLQLDESTFRSTIKISPDGSRVAYTVKSPNLTTNENEIELYVRKLPPDPRNSGKPIVVGDISAVRWRADSSELTALMKENGRRMLEEVDPVTGVHHILVKADTDIEEYSMARDDGTIAYATRVSAASQDIGPTAQEISSGYRIP